MRHQIVVTTPATVTSLTTLARLKSELGITDTSSDALLTSKIAEASSDIAVRVEPSLKREVLTETLRWENPWYYGLGYSGLALSRTPIVTIASITVDGSLLSSADYYHTDDVDHWSGLVYRLMAGSYSSTWQFSQSVVVEYTAGYLLPEEVGSGSPPVAVCRLPPVLEAACIDLVSSYWSSRGRDPALKSEEDVGVARFEYWVGSVGASGDLPPSVMAKIGAFLKAPALA